MYMLAYAQYVYMWYNYHKYQGLVEMYASLDVSRHISAYAKLKFHGTDSKAAALARPKAFNIERSDKDGMTLLMHACGLGDAEYPGLAMRLTRVLCEHGMDVNAKHKHYKYCTAMDFAVLKGNVGAAKVLLRFGSTCKRSYVLQILKKKHKEQSVLTVLKKHAALMALFDAGDGYTDAEDFHRAARLLDDSALRGMMADKEHSAGNLAFREPMHGGCSVLQHLVWRCAGTLAVCSVSPAAQHTYQRVLECMKTVVQQVPAQIHLDSDDRALRLHFDAHRLHRRAFEGSRGHIDAYSDPYFCGGAKSVMGTSLARRHLECAQWMLLCDVAPEPGMDGQRLQQGVVVQRWAIKLRAALTFASVQSVSHCLGQISARCDVVEAVNYRDQYGRNSLFYCAHCSNVLVAQLLIKHGVALDCVDMFGDSAMDLALFHNNTPLCVFLLEQGFQASVEDMVAKIADAHYPVQIKGVGTLLIEFMMKVITAGGPNGRAVGVDSAHETLGGMRVSFGNPKAVSLMLDDKSLRLPQAFKEYVLELIGRFLRFSERKLGQHGAKLDEHTSSSNFTAPEQELEQLTWSALSQRYMSLEEMENEQSNTFEGWSSADDGDEDGDAGISGEDKKKKKQRKRKEEGAREEVKEEEAKEEGSPLSEEGAVKARIKRELAVARARAKKRNKLLAAAMPGDADAHKEEFVDHSLIKSVPRDVEYRLVWIFDSIKLPHQTPDAVDEDEDDYVCELGDVLLFLENSKIKHDERFRNVDLGASLYSAAATEESQQLDELQTEGMDEKARSRYEWTHPRAPENRQVIMLDTWLALWNSSLELDGDEPLLNMLNYFFKKSLDKRMESQLLRFSAGAAEGMESFEEMQKQRSARSKLVREQAELTASLRGIQVSESMRGGIPTGAQTY
jgi:ankyrin repeat protein